MKTSKLMIGLLGVDNDGTLIHPSGKRMFWLPMGLSRIVQVFQHYFARDPEGNLIRPMNGPTLRQWLFQN